LLQCFFVIVVMLERRKTIVKMKVFTTILNCLFIVYFCSNRVSSPWHHVYRDLCLYYILLPISCCESWHNVERLCASILLFSPHIDK